MCVGGGEANRNLPSLEGKARWALGQLNPPTPGTEFRKERGGGRSFKASGRRWAGPFLRAEAGKRGDFLLFLLEPAGILAEKGVRLTQAAPSSRLPLSLLSAFLDVPSFPAAFYRPGFPSATHGASREGGQVRGAVKSRRAPTREDLQDRGGEKAAC